jgi:hypothetical protein
MGFDACDITLQSDPNEIERPPRFLPLTIPMGVFYWVYTFSFSVFAYYYYKARKGASRPGLPFVAKASSKLSLLVWKVKVVESIVEGFVKVLLVFLYKCTTT